MARSRAQSVVRSSILIALLIGGTLRLAAIPALAADAPSLPTSAELHKSFDAGEYQPLLAKLTRVLNLKGDAAKPYDRVDLELLRANTALQTKQQTLAAASLDEAVKAITDQTAPKLANEATATRALVKRSNALAYTPKSSADGSPVKPISLTDPSQRKAALTALLADCKVEVSAKAKTAAESKSLTPIIAGINSIEELRAIELTVTDADTASQEIAGRLATQAATLMDDAIKTFTPRIKRIHDDANVLVANPQPQDTTTNKKGKKIAAAPTTYHKTGLNSNYTRELNAIVDTCHRIEAACKEFTGVAPQQAASFKTISDAADLAAKDATATLTADYTSNVTK